MDIKADIIEQIKAAHKIIIHRHENPDPDAIGSQVGLAEIIRNSYPDKEIYQVGSAVEGLSWMAQMQVIDDSLYQDALVIVVDTANTPRISDQRYNQGKTLVKIDHHPNDDAYGDYTWVKTTASSSSELIVDLVNASNGELILSDNAARLLYTGLIGDTGRFLYPATSAHTFEVAAQLRTMDFPFSEVGQKLNQISFSQAQLESWVYNHLEIDTYGAASVIIKQSVLKELGVADSQTASVVSTPGRLEDVVSWVLFVETPEGNYRVHFRSKGPIINGIAKDHDGGGHPLASGAKAANEGEIIAIQTELAQVVQNYVQGK